MFPVESVIPKWKTRYSSEHKQPEIKPNVTGGTFIIMIFSISCNHRLFFRSGSKLLTIAGTAVLASVGGSVILAKTSDGFRKFSENNIPGSSFLYSLLLGPSVSHLPTFTPTVKYSCFFHHFFLVANLIFFKQILGRWTSKEKVRTRSIKENRWYFYHFSLTPN